MKYWQQLVNAESKKSWWDFFHNSEEKMIRISRFDHESHYLDEWLMTYEEWEDLCALMKRIDVEVK